MALLQGGSCFMLRYRRIHAGASPYKKVIFFWKWKYSPSEIAQKQGRMAIRPCSKYSICHEGRIAIRPTASRPAAHIIGLRFVGGGEGGIQPFQ